MPAKEIKELRQSGKLMEAYEMASNELAIAPDDIWAKRNISWVLYSQLDGFNNDLTNFLEKLSELKALGLPGTEEMLFDNISLVISKAVRNITSKEPIDFGKVRLLFNSIKELPLKRPSKWYTVLFKAFHKALKDSDSYLEFADWWNFTNFLPDDFQKEKMPNGKEVMAVAEQGYIAYAKHLLPRHDKEGRVIFNKDKTENFLPQLVKIVDDYPQFQYPAYFQAKILLALGDKEDMLSAIIPFAKKKKNDFWVWDIMSEAFKGDDEKVFSFYCKALSCESPEEMLVNLRQKMAALLIRKQLYNEAKTEIELLIASKNRNEFKIPAEVEKWRNEEWYVKSVSAKSNVNLYCRFTGFAEEFLYADIQAETVIVEFVNSDKKILNFIESETKLGFFKYERFLKDVKIGDVLKVRFKSGEEHGIYQVYTVEKITDDVFKNKFLIKVDGIVKIQDGKSFGFLNNVFIHPSLVSQRKLTNGMQLEGLAMKTYNDEKKQWSWKLI